LKTKLPEKLRSKTKTKGKKFHFSQRENLLKNKKLPKTKRLKKIGKLLRGNQKSSPLLTLKAKLKGQKLKGERKLKSEKNGN
jgi:hypothetical protein